MSSTILKPDKHGAAQQDPGRNTAARVWFSRIFIAGTLFQGELVKVFLAPLYYDAGSQFFGAVALGYVVYLDIIHSDAALQKGNALCSTKIIQQNCLDWKM